MTDQTRIECACCQPTDEAFPIYGYSRETILDGEIMCGTCLTMMGVGTEIDVSEKDGAAFHADETLCEVLMKAQANATADRLRREKDELEQEEAEAHYLDSLMGHDGSKATPPVFEPGIGWR